jgi:hypothetical protein
MFSPVCAGSGNAARTVLAARAFVNDLRVIISDLTSPTLCA